MKAAAPNVLVLGLAAISLRAVTLRQHTITKTLSWERFYAILVGHRDPKVSRVFAFEGLHVKTTVVQKQPVWNLNLCGRDVSWSEGMLGIAQHEQSWQSSRWNM